MERLIKQTEKWEYYGSHFHALFEWLEIDEIINVKDMKDLEPYPFLSIHPHYYPADKDENNLNSAYLFKTSFSTLETASFSLLAET